MRAENVATADLSGATLPISSRKRGKKASQAAPKKRDDYSLPSKSSLPPLPRKAEEQEAGDMYVTGRKPGSVYLAVPTIGANGRHCKKGEIY